MTTRPNHALQRSASARARRERRGCDASTGIKRITLLILCGFVFAGCQFTRDHSYQDAALRSELLEMMERDQKVREGLTPTSSQDAFREAARVDKANETRMRQIIAEYGWPGKSLVGADGAHAAWLVVQHAPVSFREHCLPLMEKAVAKGEASPRDYAYLLDRVLVHQGKKQIYGTQFSLGKDGEWVMDPVEEPEKLNQRRASVGMQPIDE